MTPEQKSFINDFERNLTTCYELVYWNKERYCGSYEITIDKMTLAHAQRVDWRDTLLFSEIIEHDVDTGEKRIQYYIYIIIKDKQPHYFFYEFERNPLNTQPKYDYIDSTIRKFIGIEPDIDLVAMKNAFDYARL